MTVSLAIEPASAPFHVMVKPIGPICNLDCAYCFYLDKQSMFPATERFPMTEEVLERFTRQYIGSQPEGTREVSFGWQGGEPTLIGLDFFRRAVELQARYARPGMRFSNALQTNGTRLDDEWGRFLHDHDFLVGISIDGPEELHDRYRLDKHGKGSFREVMRGVDVLERNGCEWNTLTVLQRDNSRHPGKVYRFLKELGSTFLQLIPIVEVEGPGEVSSRSVRPEQFGRFLVEVFDLWRRQDIGRVSVQHFDVVLGQVMGRPSSICVHAKVCGRAVALEHNGDLYSCDHFVFPEYHLGNIAEASLSEMLDGDKQQAFGYDKHSGLPGVCLDCEYLQLCNGGCPADRILKSKDGEDGLNYLCAGYKEFYGSTRSHFRGMAAAMSAGRPASEYQQFMPGAHPTASEPGRNARCPCGSGLKYKRCCGRR